jgi:tetratricopeptide (TPR) repeat protein
VIPGRRQQNALRIQDKMVLNIVDSNKWRRPVYFAVTVGDDNYMGLDPYLQMQGLAYRIMPVVVPQDQRVDIDRSVYLLDHVYRFRGLGDGKGDLDETAQKLLSNYASCYIQVALALRKPLMDMRDEIAAQEKQLSDTTKKVSPDQAALLADKRREYEQKLDLVVAKMDQCVALMPGDWRPRMLRQEFLANHGRAAEAEKRAREALLIDPDNIEYVKMLAQSLDLEGKHQQANGMLKKIAERDPDPWNAYVTLARNYEEQQQYDSALMVIEEFAQSHPGDRRSAELIARFNELKKAAAPGAGPADTGKKQGFPIKVGPKG